jgi:hypothetical protein
LNQKNKYRFGGYSADAGSLAFRKAFGRQSPAGWSQKGDFFTQSGVA